MTRPDSGFSGKYALVTGGGSGIGRATAEHLARGGARVALIGRGEEKLDEVVTAIAKEGGEARCHVADVSSVGEMESVFHGLESGQGRLDIVVANAGINGTWASIEELTADDWTKTIGINLTGTFLTVKLAVPLLKKRGGSVVIVSSVNGTRMFSNAGASAYATSKAGQVAFGRMMALELARHRIRVNTVCPGKIETDIEERTSRENIGRLRPPVEFPEGSIPLTSGAPGSADEVAELICFLSGEHAAHITGTEVFIDGAQSLFEG